MDIAAANSRDNKEQAEGRQTQVSSHSDALHKRHLKTSLTLVAAMLISILSTILLLYFETLETEEQNLRRTLQAETNLIESVARFDAIYSVTDTVGKGTGQGLSIVYSVITEKHNGSLNVQSNPEEGSEFEIRLPI